MPTTYMTSCKSNSLSVAISRQFYHSIVNIVGYCNNEWLLIIMIKTYSIIYHQGFTNSLIKKCWRWYLFYVPPTAKVSFSTTPWRRPYLYLKGSTFHHEATGSYKKSEFPKYVSRGGGGGGGQSTVPMQVKIYCFK